MSSQRRTALELLLVTLFGSPLVTPLLRWTATPCSHDGHLHYHRVVAMLHAWRDGLYFSRWLPDLAFGYGYPFFLYREPLPLYLTLWSHLLGLPMPAAINFFYAACILAGGWFTYLWVRDVFNTRAALVSAVAYMVAPYQLVDALVRGNQVESLALALFPLVLWAARRFMLYARVRWFILSTLGLAALALSHNISLLLFTPALLLYLLFVGWLAGLGWKAALGRTLLIMGLGLALTAFYTAPAVLEIDEVTLTLSTSNRNNDFHFNFASPSEVLAPVMPEDPALLNPPLHLRLGWAPVALALLGLLSLAWNRRREQRLHILFMTAGALLYLFFALPLSEPLWEALPLIEFVQFPWRFVGRAALPLAFLAGVPFATGVPLASALRIPPLAYGRLPVARLRLLLLLFRLLPLAVALVILVVEALPLLYPAYCVEEPYPTIQDVHAYEQSSGMVGVDPVGSYFPVTVQSRPQSSPLLEDYATGRTPQRFDQSVLPAAAEVIQATYEPLRAQIEIQSPHAFEARYLAFAFPGWTATVDGEPAPITPEEASGLLTFPVPTGKHTLVVAWRLTPLRAAMGVVSGVAALGLVAAALALWNRPSPLPPQQAQVAPHALSNRSLLTVGMLGLLLLGGKLLLVDRMPTPLRRSAAPSVSYTTDLSAGGLQLTGYNLSRTTVPSGGTFDVSLAWQVQSSPDLALQSNVWLRDEEGLIWSARETFRPRIFEDPPPVQQWQPGQWAWDSREVQVLSGTPPGRYQIVLTLFDRADLQPLTLLRAGNAVGPTAVIGEIEVQPPRTPPQFEPQHRLLRAVGELRLLGYNQDRAQAAPGDPLLLTLFWENPPERQLLPYAATTPLTLSLHDATGTVRHEWQIRAVREEHAPAEWQAGQRLRSQHLLRLPATLDSGAYRLWLEDVALGELQVVAPQRLFEEPDYDKPVNQVFGGQVRLLGYSLAPVPELKSLPSASVPALTVTLLWQGLEEMQTSYRVFVHLVDGAGQIIAQSDAEPAQWARPTTGWMPGEYVVDEHALNLPAQLPAVGLALRVGLFEPESSERLQLPSGEEFVLLQP